MPLELVTVPCLSDNYAFLVHDAAAEHTTLVDIPEAGPIVAALEARGWSLDQILITHHHWDHVEGLDDLRKAFPDARIVGAQVDAHRLPDLDTAVAEGDTVTIGTETGTVIDVSGHTIGHVAFHFPGARLLFTADSLMALGCGRVFEGTKPQMYQSLQKLVSLPPETVVCSGHEYTQANARFALSVDPDNARLRARAEEVDRKRAAGEPTVPSTLEEELATNPFLRAHDPAIAAHLGLADADPVDVFVEIRTRKDNF